MNISKRFTYLREQMGMNKGSYARFLNITPSEVSDVENSKIEPSRRILSRLSEKQKVNIGWLLTGEGEPFIKPDTEPPKPAILRELENIADEQTAPKFRAHEERLNSIEETLRKYDAAFKQIQRSRIAAEQQPEIIEDKAPVYTALKPEEDDYEEPEETTDLPLALNLAAGVPIEAIDAGETYSVPVRLIPRKPESRYCVAKINGRSMTDAGIDDGSYVLLEYFDEPINNEFMIVKYGSETTLKLLRRNKQGGWELWYQDGSGQKIALQDGDWEVKGKFICVLPKRP